ncbi:MAG TPA: universal stress protein [Steroidobacteraceae bacterium]|jgi:universal stress protein A|nr:universal stress protein [Steroidobacteraceae bacterium]
MSAYRRILVAVDLSHDSHAIGNRALQVAAPGAALRLLHVVGFVPIEPMSDSLVPVVQIDDQMIARAREQIEALARELTLAPDTARVETGNVKSEILRYAREEHSDLIVIGCRERHGLSLLVHRTENSVLHGAPCDVLAVRVRDLPPGQPGR